MAKGRNAKAQATYKKFHGRASQNTGSVDFSAPKALVYLGKAVALEYESDKQLQRVHRSRLYRHKFGKKVQVLAHPFGKWLLIHGGNFRVSDWLRG